MATNNTKQQSRRYRDRQRCAAKTPEQRRRRLSSEETSEARAARLESLTEHERALRSEETSEARAASYVVIRS